jgi:superfamily I DNA/RNA helicase
LERCNAAEFFSHFKRSMHGTNYANYRSTQAICEAANSITANSKLFSMRKVETLLKPMVVAVAKGEDVPASLAEAAMVAREIGRVVGLGGRVSAASRMTMWLSFFARTS